MKLSYVFLKLQTKEITATTEATKIFHQIKIE